MFQRFVLSVMVFLLLAPCAAVAESFVDVAQTAGLIGQTHNSWGMGWADYDLDGDLDLFTHTHLQVADEPGQISQLWRNNGDGSFYDVSDESGISHFTGDTHGAVWGDMDNDGDPDLYVVNGTPKYDPLQYNQIWRNNGDGTFTDLAASDDEVGGWHRGRGASAVDFDLDGQHEFFRARYYRVGRDAGNMLLRNQENGGFVDVGPTSGIDRLGVKNRTASWGDVNNDGYADLLVMPPCALFLNNGDGTFRDITASAGIEPSLECTASAWEDYNDDGFSDIYISRGMAEDYPDILYRNNRNNTFTDVTAMSGIDNVTSARGVSWGDYDNDGDKDIYVVSMNNFRDPNRLWRNNGNGTFADVAALEGVKAHVVKGVGGDASFVDYDNDGDLDLFVTNGEANGEGPYMLFQNQGSENHWLSLQLKGVSGTADALMSRVQVVTGTKRQNYTQSGPAHFMSQSRQPLHLGLGEATKVDRLLVTWPHGEKQLIENLAADQRLVLEEGKSLWEGAPTKQGPGFYIWREGIRWKLKWHGESSGNSFSGSVTAAVKFPDVRPVWLESTDSVALVSTRRVEFAATEGFVGADMVDLVAVGAVTFDLFIDGEPAPAEKIFIGAQGLHPGSLPVTLRHIVTP